MAKMIPFLKNPRHLAISNPGRKKGKSKVARIKRIGRRSPRRGQKRKTARRAYEGDRYIMRGAPRGRKRLPWSPPARRRRNPLVVRNRNRNRKNPVIPGGMIGQMLMVGAGYLVAPLLSNMIPWRSATQAGEYLKRAGVVVVGSQVLGKVVGRKFGNALFVGGMISIAVDVLRNYVPALGGGAMAAAPEAIPNADGMSYYFPPNAELAAMYAGNNGESALASAPGLPGEYVGRFASRF